jgi:hypothetical protein
MKCLRDFAFSIGRRYQELEPNAGLVSPYKDHNLKAHEGWAYCARTPDKGIILAYFEKSMPRARTVPASGGMPPSISMSHHSGYSEPPTRTHR